MPILSPPAFCSVGGCPPTVRGAIQHLYAGRATEVPNGCGSLVPAHSMTGAAVGANAARASTVWEPYGRIWRVLGQLDISGSGRGRAEADMEIVRAERYGGFC